MLAKRQLYWNETEKLKIMNSNTKWYHDDKIVNELLVLVAFVKHFLYPPSLLESYRVSMTQVNPDSLNLPIRL